MRIDGGNGKVMTLLTMAALGLACASAEESGTSAEAPILVEVQNDNYHTVDVFVVSGGQTLRLGTVTTRSEETFTLPRALLRAEQVRFLVDPIGPLGAYLSDHVVIQPGQTIVLEVQPNLGTSVLTAR